MEACTAVIMVSLTAFHSLIVVDGSDAKNPPQDQNQRTKAELAANAFDREVRGYGPHMAASTERVEAEDTGVIREAQADSVPIFEVPGDPPALSELSDTSRRGGSLDVERVEQRGCANASKNE